MIFCGTLPGFTSDEEGSRSICEGIGRLQGIGEMKDNRGILQREIPQPHSTDTAISKIVIESRTLRVARGLVIRRGLYN